jgi:hypothetical protein
MLVQPFNTAEKQTRHNGSQPDPSYDFRADGTVELLAQLHFFRPKQPRPLYTIPRSCAIVTPRPSRQRISTRFKDGQRLVRTLSQRMFDPLNIYPE